MRESPIRDLSRQLREVARQHEAYSQVADFMNHVNNHLSAIAFVEEVHQGRCYKYPLPLDNRTVVIISEDIPEDVE